VDNVISTGDDADDIEVRREIVQQYYKKGVALIDTHDVDSKRAIARLESLLRLDARYVPTWYDSSRMTADGTLRLAAGGAQSEPGPKAAFENTGEQALHCDGTLCGLGEVPTSILHCSQAAAEGGETYFFQSVEAFEELSRHDPEAATALTGDSVLVRRAELGNTDRVVVGPAFGRSADGAELITRFSLGPLDSWCVPASNEGLAVVRALRSLTQAVSSRDPRFFFSVRLRPGQAVVFRNDKISHGRHSYKNSPTATRKMARALYTQKVKDGSL
jgi:alpha-ketoglutarate-dependent taurine dioxygenase